MEVKLGTLPDDTAQRDAIHVAVAPVIAGEQLIPGQHIGFLDDARTKVGSCKHAIGIVDPFLNERVIKPGQRVFLVLYPGSVVGMRHHWKHPMFPDADAARMDEVAFSEEWLRRYAKNLNCYEKDPDLAFAKLLDDLRANRIHAYGNDLTGLYDLDSADDLKLHAERYLGIPIVWERFDFSCSC